MAPKYVTDEKGRKARFFGIPIVDNKSTIKKRVKERKKGGLFHPDDMEGTLVGKLSSVLPMGQIRKMHERGKITKKKVEELKIKKAKTKAEKEKLEAKNEAVTNPKPKTESKTKDSAEKAAWLKKTRRSPAAKNFSDDERWALQQRHRAWKAARKKKKN